MKPGKVSQLASGIRQLADVDEPIGQLLAKTELAKARFLLPVPCCWCC